MTRIADAYRGVEWGDRRTIPARANDWPQSIRRGGGHLIQRIDGGVDLRLRVQSRLFRKGEGIASTAYGPACISDWIRVSRAAFLSATKLVSPTPRVPLWCPPRWAF